MVHATRKTLTEAGDKATQDEKDAIETAIKELEEALKGDDKGAIEAKTEALIKVSGPLAQKMAEGANAGQSADANTSTAKDDNVVDAEFEEVKDDKK